MTPSPEEKSPIYHIPSLDGRRGVAILSVLPTHGFRSLPLPEWCLGERSLLKTGELGVDIFFVPSGYLIHSLTAREPDRGRFNLGNFHWKRCLRIPPAAYLWRMKQALFLGDIVGAPGRDAVFRVQASKALTANKRRWTRIMSSFPARLRLHASMGLIRGQSF